MSNWPVHNNPRQERAAKAPYNFVPLPERVVTVDPKSLPDQDRYYSDRHTGWIDCQLTTASPLYVRAALEPDEFERSLDEKAEGELSWREQVGNKPDFFYTDEQRQPVIPGSSLRGMLRRLVEIVGHAKVQPVSRERLVYRAVGDTTSFGLRYRQRVMREDSKRCYTPLMQAGYVEKHKYGWRIRLAQNLGGTTFARIWRESVPADLPEWHGCRNARQIWIEPGPYEYKDVRGGFIRVKYSNVVQASAGPALGLIQGTWVRSGKMLSKRFDMVIFPEDEKAEPIPIPEKLVIAYREQLSQEQISLLGKEGVLRDKQPIFYLIEDGELVFFSHTMMMRLPYQKSPNDFIPSELRSDDEVDLAEATFGYIGLDIEDRARAGRVFFSDATLAQEQGDVYLSKEPVIPQILSSPKPTTFQHYLVQQTPDKQPAGRTKDGKPKYKVVLSHYASPTPSETVIRGHKFYWHKGDVGQNQIAETEEVGPNDTQHTRFKPVRSGVRFAFRIHFENLSNIELGALLWALTLPGPGDYCHKLGMGKPLGMGSVKIESELHLTDRRARYQELFDGDTWELGQKGIDVADEQRQALQAFEQVVLGNEYLNPGGKAQSLAEVPRVQTLLALLSWPGPSPEKTEYITDLKEFTKRKVLPTPLAVVGEDFALSPPAPTGEGRPAPSSGRCTGRVKWFNSQKGYGFIRVDESQEEVFVHYTDIKGERLRMLNENDRVEFSIEKDAKGLKAVDVWVMEG
jgi:CRISPR-associated protein (TIGR03986 family)